MKNNSLHNICTKCLWIVSLATVFVLLALNLVYNSTVSYASNEKVTVYWHLSRSLFIILIVSSLLLLCSYIRKKIDKINDKALFWILSLIYVLMSIYLIVNVDRTLRADANLVFEAAKQITAGKYDVLANTGYIGRYPHQTGLLFYDQILQVFTRSAAISFFANILFVIGINYFTVKTARLLWQSKEVTIATTLISFAFLPQFFFILFAYGLTPGFFFMTLAFYNAIKFAKDKNLLNAVYMSLGTAFAIFFKQNFLIGAVAIIIYIALQLLSEKKDRLKVLLALIFLVSFMFIPSTLVKSYYRSVGDVELDQGAPSILWVVMGTDIDNTGRAPGWYNAYNWVTYTKSGYNTEQSSKMGSEGLKSNIEKIKNDPARTVKFFYLKTISQWCDPMFQSVWTGPLESCGQKTNTPLLQSIYSGGSAEKIIAFTAKTLVIVILGFTLAFLLLAKDKSGAWQIALMFLIGGLLFHSVWEGKSQYTYPYVFTLIPYACYGIKAAVDKIDSVLLKSTKASTTKQKGNKSNG